MKNNLKKIISLILCLSTLALAMASFSSCAAAKFEFELNNGGESYSVTAYNGNKTVVKIPTKYKGKPVSAIANEAFYSNTTVEKVVIGDGVTEIGFHAFANCTSLQEVELPNGLIKIASGAFEKCTSLKEIVIPEGVENVIDGAFMDCTALSSVSLPSTLSRISGLAFIGCYSLSKINVADANKSYKVQDGNLVSSDGTLVAAVAKYNYAIADGIKAIGAGAFNGRTLQTIVIPASVEVIGQLAFANCVQFHSVYYLGSESEYNAVEIGDMNPSFTKATIYFYSETEPVGEGNFWHYVNDRPTSWK